MDDNKNEIYKIMNYKPFNYADYFSDSLKESLKSFHQTNSIFKESINVMNFPYFRAALKSIKETLSYVNPMAQMIQDAIRPLQKVNMGEQISAALSSINWEGLKFTAEISKIINTKIDVHQLEIMADLGWTVPTFIYPTLHVYNVSFLKKEEINRYMLSLYCRNNFSYLIETLNSIAENTDEEYKIIVYQIIDVLNRNWKNYKLCIANIFMLIEHCSLKKKSPNMRVKRNFNVGMLKELIIENDDQDIYTIAEQQCRVTIQKYLITQDFSKPEQLFFGRHTYLHGRFSPERVSFADFIRLINNTAFYFEVL